MEKFAIIHELPDTQCLIHKWYEPDTDDFHLSFKCWSTTVNGFITMSIQWPKEQESDWERTFNEFENSEKAERWLKGINAKTNKP